MSKLALQEYDNACLEQSSKNDAKRIYYRVKAAQDNPVRAGLRWPFELVQNAHDAGPREGNDHVEIDFTLSDDRIIVSHTGKPFDSQELSALLSGGSSKEFDDEDTTGRFGTGFLVSHAVSTNVTINGVLATPQGHESFKIELERGGDEDSIITNIGQAREALENAELITADQLTDSPTALFTYHTSDYDVARRGLDRLEQTLPYLYATCGRLGNVRINRLGEEKIFVPCETEEFEAEGFLINKTLVNIRGMEDSGFVTAVRVGQKGCKSALLVVLDHCEDDGLCVRVPSAEFSRIFVTFPIAGTGFLPFNTILDGTFTPSQERDGITMHNADRLLIDSALSAFPMLIRHAVESEWQDAHKLARLAVPDRLLSGEAESGEMEWWQDIVLRTAKETAANPLVRTDEGLLPVLVNDEGPFVSFPVPAIYGDATNYIDHDAFHTLAGAITDLELPDRTIAESWGDIARQWNQVGVPVHLLGLYELTDWIKESGGSIDDLPVDEEPFLWLAEVFLFAAELEDQNVRDMINGLLPDQNGDFTDTDEYNLYIDGGISAEIKDIAASLNKDLRSLLLHDEMLQALKAPGYDKANTLIHNLLDRADGGNGEYTEGKAIDLVLDILDERLPEEVTSAQDLNMPALLASARLVTHLAENGGEQEKLRSCPLLSSAEGIVRLSGRGLSILAPVRYWPESARPYAGLYTENRILSDRYCEHEVLVDALDSLVVVGLAIEAPLFNGRRAEVTDVNLLREMAPSDEDSTGVTVRGATFGQIAFLPTELVNRCGQDREIAKLLLDFVLNVAAQEDQSWRRTDSYPAFRSGEQMSINLNKAIWPSELKVRSWIPVKAPDADDTVPMPANESNIREILEPSWLRDNRAAVDLLHEVFGFSRLTLALDRFGPEIEDDLGELLQDPDLVKAAAANPDAVRFASDLTTADIALDTVRDFVHDARDDEELLGIVANRREQRLRGQESQKLGANVEDLVCETLKDSGFSVRRTGTGSDFEISVEVGDVTNLEVTRDKKTWLLEVKATRDQRVRMTDVQAQEAVNEDGRFLLCVVPVDAGDTSLEVDGVRANMRFVSGIGERVVDLCINLDNFEETRSDITANTNSGVQLEISPSPARVSVAKSVWEDDGFPLDELKERLLK